MALDRKITLEEFRHALINVNDRGFDETKLKLPVPIPESADQYGGISEDVLEVWHPLFWEIFLQTYREKGFGGLQDTVSEQIEDAGLTLDSTADEADENGFTSEWPVEQYVENLEAVYETATRHEYFADEVAAHG